MLGNGLIGDMPLAKVRGMGGFVLHLVYLQGHRALGGAWDGALVGQ